MANEDFTTKECTKCHTIKPLTDFHLISKGEEKRSWYCKTCSNTLRVKYSLKNKDGERIRKHNWYCKNLDGNRMTHKEWRDALRQKARDYFSDMCFLCGKKVFIKVSDFNIHHKDGSNNHNGHAMWHPESWEQCVLLCKPCHYMLHGASRLPREKFSTLLYQLKEKA